MDGNNPIEIYEMSINFRVTLHAHSLSNNGTNGSNRLLPRRQMLAGGILTDACSGSIFKHYDSVLTTEYLEAFGSPLCPACRARDARRAAALVKLPGYQKMTMDRILRECALCDIHGFLITAKNANDKDQPEARLRLAKHTLVDYAMTLALPESHAESEQVNTRSGNSKEDGQMILKIPCRSGQYAEMLRYKAVGIGVDTEKWKIAVTEGEERRQRHRAVLSALRDRILSPSGAQTATMLPHLAGLVGAIVIRMSVGLAPVYSPLCEDFVERLRGLAIEKCQVLPFDSVDEFSSIMNNLMENSVPGQPMNLRTAGDSVGSPKDNPKSHSGKRKKKK